MYVKQNEMSDVHETPNIHEGEGVILRRSMFREQSKLPIRMEVWELEPGVTEGDHTHEGEGELEEIYYFLEGEGVMSVEGEDVPIARATRSWCHQASITASATPATAF